MISHVKGVRCTPICYLVNTASIRSCLTQKSAVRLIHCLVLSIIYNANCLLYDLTDCLICRLQRVQNATSRLVVRCHRYEHSVPVFMKQHWLPWTNAFSTQSCYWRTLHNMDWHYLSPLTYSNQESIECGTMPPFRTHCGDRMFSIVCYTTVKFTSNCLVNYKRLENICYSIRKIGPFCGIRVPI